MAGNFKKFKRHNRDPEHEELFWNNINKVKEFPQALKNLIFQMIRFDDKERISTLCMYKCMLDLMEKWDSELKLSLKQSLT